jgi:hypothetical protein
MNKEDQIEIRELKKEASKQGAPKTPKGFV